MGNVSRDDRMELMEGSGSAESQQNVWLGDMIEGGVKRVRLEAGDTM